MYLRAGDRFIECFNTGQQKRLLKPTFSTETELEEDIGGPG